MSKNNQRMNLLWFILCLITSFSVKAQKKVLSDFITSTHTKAFYDSMLSSTDTIIINNISEPWIFEPITLRNLKNKVIFFEKGIVIEAKKDSYPRTIDALWKFIDCTDINIIGNHSTMRMNKDEYTDGEWRHVIRLRGCKNITISDLTLRDSGGDGIAVGRSEKAWYSENITLTNLQCINNKRQGISITSAENLWVSDSCFIGTKGTAPGAGLDIEPDKKEERIVNVNFSNCEFKNNYYVGINIGLPKLSSESTEVSIAFLDCQISNNFDAESAGVPAEIRIISNKTNPVKGNVVFKRCEIIDSKWPMLFARKNGDGFHVTFEDCIAKNVCQSEGCGAVIYMEVPHYRKVSDFGGYHFKNVYLDYQAKKPIFMVRGSKLAFYNIFKNVTGKIKYSNLNKEVKPEITYLNYDSSSNQNVSLILEKIAID